MSLSLRYTGKIQIKEEPASGMEEVDIMEQARDILG